MSFTKIFKYKEKQTLIHKLDPRAKLFLLISLSIVSIIIGNPLFLLLIFLSTIPLWVLFRPSWIRIKGLIIAYSIIGFGFVLTQGFFYYWEPKTILFVVIPPDFPVLGPLTGGLYLYTEGIFYGALQTIRILTTINLSLLLISSTHPSELLLSLNRIGLPYTLSFMVATAVRFAPTMLEEGNTILNAMKTRGFKTGGFHKFTALRLLFFPLLNNTLKKARQTAIAADLRGFRAVEHRTFLKELNFTRGDYLLFLFSFIYLATGIYLSLIGYGAAAPGIGG
ncbi:MAG: energy-coupling factor transporter transmembrane component T family protein [Candidatus Helarchaeota archaeon]